MHNQNNTTSSMQLAPKRCSQSTTPPAEVHIQLQLEQQIEQVLKLSHEYDCSWMHLASHCQTDPAQFARLLLVPYAPYNLTCGLLTNLSTQPLQDTSSVTKAAVHQTSVAQWCRCQRPGNENNEEHLRESNPHKIAPDRFQPPELLHKKVFSLFLSALW